MENVAVEQPESEYAATEKMYREKITKTLSVFPELSLSMLHIGLGPSLPSKLWKPILMRMVEEGLVDLNIKVHENKSYQVYKLRPNITPAPEHTLKNV